MMTKNKYILVVLLIFLFAVSGQDSRAQQVRPGAANTVRAPAQAAPAPAPAPQTPPPQAPPPQAPPQQPPPPDAGPLGPPSRPDHVREKGSYVDAAGKRHFSSVYTRDDIVDLLEDAFRKTQPKVKFGDFSFDLSQNMDPADLNLIRNAVTKGELSVPARNEIANAVEKYCKKMSAKYIDFFKKENKNFDADFEVLRPNVCRQAKNVVSQEILGSGFAIQKSDLVVRYWLDLNYGSSVGGLAFKTAKKTDEIVRAYKVSVFGKVGLPFDTGLLVMQVMSIVSTVISLILLVRMFVS